MGIKNLHSFLRKKCPSVYKTVPLSSYKDRFIAIDLSIYLFKYKILFGNRWLDAFLTLIYNLSHHNIGFVFVYDTKAPPEKYNERRLRSEARLRMKDRLVIIKKEWDRMRQDLFELHRVDKIIMPPHEQILEPIFLQFLVRLLPEDCTLYRKSIDDEIRRIENSLEYISTKEFDCTKELFSICGVPFIDSKGEAEATCSVMNKTGIVAAVLTDDTDVMACMAPVMLYKLNFEDQTCTEITIQDVLEALELQPSQFIDFCIMCGTDYNGSIQKIGCEKAYKLIREFQTIENIDQYTDIPVTVFNHVRTREIFNMDAISSSDDYRIPPRRPIDKKRLVEFCFTNNCEFDIERFFYTADATRSGHIRMIKPF